VKNAATGYVKFPDGEVPPPSALAGRRVIGEVVEREKPRGRLGKGLFGIFYPKFDQEPLSAPRGGVREPVKEARRKTVMYDANAMDVAPQALTPSESLIPPKSFFTE
jgi:hypothetical protein